MKVKFLGKELKNQITTAAGTFNYEACKKFYDPALLGAVTTKGVSSVAWSGNPLPRIAESYGGMINSVGLENKGVDNYIKDELEKLKKAGAVVISNVAGHSEKEFFEVVEKLNETKVDMLEINISCPNIHSKGKVFSSNNQNVKKLIKKLRAATKKPLIVKLSPNTSDIEETARIVESEGADAVSLINTLTAMRIDIKTASPILKNRYGGMSGASVKPVGIALVNKVFNAVKIPIVGMGGVKSGEDAYEYLLAGASLVAVGTAALIEPKAPIRIIDELEAMIKEYGNPYLRREFLR